LDSDEVILCALPLYNTFGLNQCINATIYLGATLVLLPKFDPLSVLQSIENWKCTFFPAVPTMLQRVLDFPEVDHFNLTSLRRFCVGAAPVPGPLLIKLRQRIAQDAIVIHGYGLTESTALVTTIQVVLDENGLVRNAKSIGRALPGIEMRIAAENGTNAQLGQVGEICIKGPCVMKGYYNAPEATSEAIVDGWLHTGDLGTMDVEGFFNIVDRKKDLIIRGGQNIYPVDIEEVLYHHPLVAEAAVIARPNEELGEVPVAFVSLKLNEVVTVDELLALCKSELAYYKVPASIQILSELPKGPTGKILRRALRAH
jgi:long-chain acyl-CoA synthetase